MIDELHGLLMSKEIQLKNRKKLPPIVPFQAFNSSTGLLPTSLCLLRFTMLKIIPHIIFLNDALKITLNIGAILQTLEIFKAWVISKATLNATVISRTINVFLVVVVLSQISLAKKLLVKSATNMIMKLLTVHKE